MHTKGKFFYSHPFRVKIALYNNDNLKDCEIEEKSQTEPTVHHSLLWHENPLLSSYLTNENEELDQINENTGEQFPTDSLGNTSSHLSKQIFLNL